MTNLRQAAQQALEALTLSIPKPRPADDDYAELGWKEHNAAITALRAALAEPEQEPVAWADDVGAVIPHSHKLFVPGLCKNYTRPLYAAPTKWKELTIEDIDAIANVYMEKDRTIRAWGCFAQAIEDKLKEKNNGS